MARQHLTDKNITSLPASGRQTEYHDTVLRGLVLRVTANGVRTYGLRYRFAGQARRLHVGEVGVLSLADARQQARVLLADVAKGVDPVALREAQRRAAEEARQKVTHERFGQRPSCGSPRVKQRTGGRGRERSSSALPGG